MGPDFRRDDRLKGTVWLQNSLPLLSVVFAGLQDLLGVGLRILDPRMDCSDIWQVDRTVSRTIFHNRLLICNALIYIHIPELCFYMIDLISS
jgi:hypothetical protein